MPGGHTLGCLLARGRPERRRFRLHLRDSMRYLPAALRFFGILTLGVPGYWAVAVFEIGACGVAVGALVRGLRNPPRFVYPLAPVLFAVVWGLFEWWTGLTVSPIETRIAVARWACLGAVFLTGWVLFQDERVCIGGSGRPGSGSGS